MIDLDRDTVPPARPRRERRRAVAATALVLAGALAGSAVTYVQVTTREAGRRDATVSVLLLATPNPLDDIAVRSGPARPVTADVRVTVVNTGPVAISFSTLTAARPGVTLAVAEKQRQIGPGAAVPADAVLTVDCEAGYPLRELEATLSVVDHTDAARTVRATFPVALWDARLQVYC